MQRKKASVGTNWLATIGVIVAVIVGMVSVAATTYLAGVSHGEGNDSRVRDDLRAATARLADLQKTTEDFETRNKDLSQRLQQISPAAKLVCPSQAQFHLATERSRGDFAAKELPDDGAAVVMQMVVVQLDNTNAVVTICKDKTARYWYMNFGEVQPLYGVVAPAFPTRSGFRSEYVFDQTVSYEIGQSGVIVGAGSKSEVLRRVSLVCIDRENVPDSLAGWSGGASAPTCSATLARTWNF